MSTRKNFDFSSLCPAFLSLANKSSLAIFAFAVFLPLQSVLLSETDAQLDSENEVIEGPDEEGPEAAAEDSKLAEEAAGTDTALDEEVVSSNAAAEDTQMANEAAATDGALDAEGAGLDSTTNDAQLDDGISSGVSSVADPSDALVAVRGDAELGLGVVVEYDGKVVVMTSLSSLVGNRRIVVNTAGGTVVPTGQIIAAQDRDLALIAVTGSGDSIPVTEVSIDPEISDGEDLTILSPRGQVEVSVSQVSGNRINFKALDGRVYSGSPAVDGDTVVGVYSPARNVSLGTGSRSNEDLWPVGIVPPSAGISWEGIDLRTVASERERLDEIRNLIEQLAVFLGVGSRDTQVTLQRLLSAQSRLKDGLQRSGQDVEKDRARSSFLFSVNSTAGSIQGDLQEAEESYYSYFIPEVRALMDFYGPVNKKLQDLARNPRGVDSFAR
ncbi:MAG: hypothetical protein AAGJ81_06265 [Verrucomicrobiota bacterium]